MSRQHATPVVIEGGDATPLTMLPLGGEGADRISEAELRDLIFDHPGVLPIGEIDQLFLDAVPICTELSTPAGPIDVLLVTPSGLPVVVECKLWRNPEGRREVIGQILDYAKELARFSASDLQRETARRRGGEADLLYRLVAATGAAPDEIAFNDALTQNLRRGRFLLLIVGDGIREGVEAIAGYVQEHSGLHFTLGLVELPVFRMPGGARVVMPRIVARTVEAVRTVISVPEGMTVDQSSAAGRERETDPEVAAWSNERLQFWTEFITGLKLDDPEQPMPEAWKLGYTTLPMPSGDASSWITVYRDTTHSEVGLFLSYASSGIGEAVAMAIAQDAEPVLAELGGSARIVQHKGKPRLVDSMRVGDLADPAQRAEAFAWLRRRINDFVNALRPRVRAIAEDLREDLH